MFYSSALASHIVYVMPGMMYRVCSVLVFLFDQSGKMRLGEPIESKVTVRRTSSVVPLKYVDGS